MKKLLIFLLLCSSCLAGEYDQTKLTGLIDVDLSGVSNGQGLVYNSTSSKYEAGSVGGSVTTSYGETAFTANDATPSVSSHNTFVTSNTSLTTITGFDSAVAGQVITVRCADSYTVISGSLTHTGMLIPLLSGESLTFLYDGSAWNQIAGDVGMGRLVIIERDPLSTWIGPAQYTYTNVSCTESVRKGACAVMLALSAHGAAHYQTAFIRPNGSSDNGIEYGSWCLSDLTVTVNGIVELDDDAIFEAKHTTYSDWSATPCGVIGYWI